MCGRFNIIDDPGMHSLLKILGFDFHLPSRVNIAPTEAVPVIVKAGQQVSMREMRWWLTPSWASEMTTRYAMFNARSDKLATSKAFRGPFRHKRGVMPISSYIEWKKEGKIKQPYLIKPVDQAVFAVASIWDQWEKVDAYIESCAMITTEADKSMSWLHHRMPVMLTMETLAEWLDHSTPESRLKEIIALGLPVNLEVIPLQQTVNSGREKDPSVLDPAGESIPVIRH